MTSLGRTIAAADLAVMFAGSTLLTPLYDLYRDAFHFGELTLTAVYAVYVVGNLAALLLLGRLSDQIGRRRVALPALVLGGAAAVVFLIARGPAWLYAGRAVSGLAIGLASGTVNAWIVDLGEPERRRQSSAFAATANLLGLTLGCWLAGGLAQYAPWPLRLSYVAYLAILALMAALLFAARDPKAPQKVEPERIDLKPRIGVPAGLRQRFIAPAAAGFAAFALGGFYFALAPSVLRTLDVANRAAAGGIVGAVFVLSAATVQATRRWSSRPAMLSGLALIVVSLALLSLSQAYKFFAAGAAGMGVALALAYRGSLETINEMAPEAQRSEVVSSYLVAMYLGNALPVLGVGLLSAGVGPTVANYVFAGVIAAIALAAAVASVLLGDERPRQPQGSAAPPRGASRPTS